MTIRTAASVLRTLVGVSLAAASIAGAALAQTKPGVQAGALERAERLQADGRAALEAGEFQQARALSDQAYELSQTLSTPGLRVQAEAAQDLCDLSHVYGEFELAALYCELALSIFDSAFPTEHYSIAYTLRGQGEALRRLNRPDEAEAHLSSAAWMFQTLVPDRPAAYALTRMQLGVLEKDRGGFADAIEHFSEALEAYRRAGPNQAAMAGAAALNLADMQLRLNAYDDAAPLLAAAIESFEAEALDEDIDLAQAYGLLGRVYRARGQADEARLAFARSIAAYDAIADRPADALVDILTRAAELERRLGEVSSAGALLARAAPICVAEGCSASVFLAGARENSLYFLARGMASESLRQAQGALRVALDYSDAFTLAQSVRAYLDHAELTLQIAQGDFPAVERVAHGDDRPAFFTVDGRPFVITQLGASAYAAQQVEGLEAQLDLVDQFVFTEELRDLAFMERYFRVRADYELARGRSEEALKAVWELLWLMSYQGYTGPALQEPFVMFSQLYCEEGRLVERCRDVMRIYTNRHEEILSTPGVDLEPGSVSSAAFAHYVDALWRVRQGERDPDNYEGVSFRRAAIEAQVARIRGEEAED